MSDPHHDAVSQLADRLRRCEHGVAFTGAGISTESGIPDFRSPGGVWSRYQPVLYQEFVADQDARVRYWRMKHEAWKAYANARPNAGHEALAGLERSARLVGVITQNIDGLHQQSGSRRVIELHGTDHAVACIQCGRRLDAAPVHERVEQGEEVPRCEHCGGWLKPATISFGQNLDAGVLDEAIRLAESADVFLAIGSSLVVQPAASLPVQAKQAGAFLAIVNGTETPLDDVADVVIRAPIGQTLSRVVSAVTMASEYERS